jgi:hypothetical protein
MSSFVRYNRNSLRDYNIDPVKIEQAAREQFVNEYGGSVEAVLIAKDIVEIIDKWDHYYIVTSFEVLCEYLNDAKRRNVRILSDAFEKMILEEKNNASHRSWSGALLTNCFGTKHNDMLIPQKEDLAFLNTVYQLVKSRPGDFGNSARVRLESFFEETISLPVNED